MSFTKTARKNGAKVRAANMKQRQSLAKKYGLTVRDFMPQQIVSTAAKLGLPAASLGNLLPKATSIPLAAVPERNKPKPRRAATGDTLRQQIALALLTTLNKLL